MTDTSTGDDFGKMARFNEATHKLREAEAAFATAQTLLIRARREYNEASRDYVRSYFDEPKRSSGSVYGRFST